MGNTLDGALGSCELLLGGVTLLVLSSLAGEEDESGLVGLETIDVDLEGLDRQVLTARVDGDTDGWGKLAWDSSLLLNSVRIYSILPFQIESSIPSAQ